MWLSSQGVYSLLSLNFFYRFAFSAYKTVFALYCAAALGYGAPEVGYVLSCVGLAGIVVQVTGRRRRHYHHSHLHHHRHHHHRHRHRPLPEFDLLQKIILMKLM